MDGSTPLKLHRQLHNARSLINDAEMTEADWLSEIRPGGTEEEEEEELNEDADIGVPEARICSLADARDHLQEVRRFF